MIPTARNRRNSIAIAPSSATIEEQPKERRKSVSFFSPIPPSPTPSPSPVPILSIPVPAPVPAPPVKGIKSLCEKIDNIKPCQCDTVKASLLNEIQNQKKEYDLYKKSQERIINDLVSKLEKIQVEVKEIVEN